jgi:hypothetical protein
MHTVSLAIGHSCSASVQKSLVISSVHSSKYAVVVPSHFDILSIQYSAN